MRKLIIILLFIPLISFGQTYESGYKAGWKEGYCLNDNACIAPMAPMAPRTDESGRMIIKTSYRDGYNRGIIDGKKAKGKSGSSTGGFKTTDYSKMYEYQSGGAKEREMIGNAVDAATRGNIRTNSNNQLAPKQETVLKINKPMSFNLDETKGFVLVKAHHHIMFNSIFRGELRGQFEATPFEFISKKKKAQKFGYKKGYIYLSITNSIIDDNNFSSTWIFRDHNKRNVFSFSAINIKPPEILSEIGIFSY